jgi:type II secretory pathway pseudopilin PulG
MKTSLKAQGGFSLVEAVVTIFMVGIAIATFLPALLQSRGSIARNRHRELATTLAASVLDGERQAGYAAHPTGTFPLPTSATQADLPKVGGNIVESYVDANLQPTTADSGRKKATVTVSWSDGVNDQGAVSLTTLIAND